MASKKIAFRCYHADCANDPELEIIVEVPPNVPGPSEKKQKLVYCQRNHANLINIPTSWDARPLTFGDDVIEVRNGVPLVQGRQP